jgi:hypothetical protein
LARIGQSRHLFEGESWAAISVWRDYCSAEKLCFVASARKDAAQQEL